MKTVSSRTGGKVAIKNEKLLKREESLKQIYKQIQGNIFCYARRLREAQTSKVLLLSRYPIRYDGAGLRNDLWWNDDINALFMMLLVWLAPIGNIYENLLVCWFAFSFGKAKQLETLR